MCYTCGKWFGWLVLLLGVVYLLVDLGVWTFWGIQWWTTMFVLGGLACIGICGCCQHCCSMEEKPKAMKKKK